jgi:hypothetical protein
LCNDLIGRYPECRPVIDELRRRLIGATTQNAIGPALTLERALQDYEDRAETDKHVHRHIAATRFYLRDLLWESGEYMQSADLTGGVTNYTTLVRELYQWAARTGSHVCFVSFNYDLLLDTACDNHWGFNRYGEPANYVANESASLLKPHGSVHWAWRLSEDAVNDWRHAARIAINWGVDAPITQTARVLAPAEYHRAGSFQGVDLPTLALPVIGKTDLIWPAEQAAHFESLQGRVRRLLTIGWQGAEEHFVSALKPLVMSRARTVIVTGGSQGERDAATVFKNLAAVTNHTDRRESINGFSQFVSSEALHWLLEDVQWPWP